MCEKVHSSGICQGWSAPAALSTVQNFKKPGSGVRENAKLSTVRSGFKI